jgi:hypothetical protein
MFTYILLFVSGFAAVRGGLLNRQAASSSSSSVPQWFQTTPEIFAGICFERKEPEQLD